VQLGCSLQPGHYIYTEAWIILANTGLINSLSYNKGLTIRIHLCSKGLYVINSEAGNVQGNDIEHKMVNECNGYFCTETRILWATEEKCLKHDFEITPLWYHCSIYHVKRYQLRSSLSISIQNSSLAVFISRTPSNTSFWTPCVTRFHTRIKVIEKSNFCTVLFFLFIERNGKLKDSEPNESKYWTHLTFS